MRAVRLLKSHARVVQVDSPAEAHSGPDVICCLKTGEDDVLAIAPGTIDPRGGQAAYDWRWSSRRGWRSRGASMR